MNCNRCKRELKEGEEAHAKMTLSKEGLTLPVFCSRCAAEIRQPLDVEGREDLGGMDAREARYEREYGGEF